MKEAVKRPPWCFGWDLNPHAFAEVFETPLSADSSTETYLLVFPSCHTVLDHVRISGHGFNVSVPTGLLHIVQHRDAGITADISRKLAIPLFIHLLLN